jgi:hypothetical protein
MTHETSIVLVVSLVVVAGLLALIGLLGMRLWRSYVLRRRFGPEYEHVVEVVGDKRRAEAELEARRRRVESLHLKPLPEPELARYHEAWRGVQAHFVDEPKKAVADADRLVSEVMSARGYPMAEFEQRAADISVDHPQLITHYRAAHATAVRSADRQASTEDLRQALIHYRALFEELMEAREPVPVG